MDEIIAALTPARITAERRAKEAVHQVAWVPRITTEPEKRKL